MESTVDAFRARLSKAWLHGEATETVLGDFDKAVDALSHKSGPVVVGLRDGRSFMLHTLAALALDRPCILATESWPPEMLKNLCQPVDTALGDVPWLSYCENVGEPLPPGSLLIATGGSGGRLRFAIHDWSNLLAAIDGYRLFWQTERLDVVNVLPLHHVGGFVPVMRSFITGGECVLAHWKSLEARKLPEIPSSNTHLSLVPTQLKRLLANEAACDWLRRIDKILIGGAMVSAVLLEEAMAKNVRVNLAYGMTEALGTVAVQKSIYPPTEDAHRGASPWAEVLPHWCVKIENGEVQISGNALFKGFFPGIEREGDWYATGDTGALTKDGMLVVYGRKDRIIITGGEKVNPAIVEEVIRNTGLCRDAAVLGLDDPEWGQRVVAIVEAEQIDDVALNELLRAKLPAYELPKSYRFVARLPRNELGKLDMAALINLF